MRRPQARDDEVAVNRAAATSLAAAGVSVFPAMVSWNFTKQKWDKKPVHRGWQQLAISDAAKVASWWANGVSAVPGIELRQAGLIVVDADRHPGGADGVSALETLAAAHVWPPHPIVVTAGGGRHHYFRQPDGLEFGNSAGRLPSGIDIRGAGGWIVGPGAIRGDGKAWSPVPSSPSLLEAVANDTIPELPDWLVALIRPRQAEQQAEHPARPWSAAEQACLQSALTVIPADDRETWVMVGMALHETGWAQAQDVWNAWSQTSPGAYDADDQEKQWRNFSRPFTRRRVTVASIYDRALELGWVRPADLPPDAAKAAALPIFWYPNDPYAAAGWLVDELVPETGHGLLAGPWGSFKSFLVVDLSGAVAIPGSTFAGRPVRRHGGVLFLAVEGAAEITKRLRARHEAAGGSGPLPFAWSDQCPSLLDKSALQILVTTAKQVAEQMTVDHGVELVLVVIDTMAAAAGYQGEGENQTGDTQQVMNVLRDLSRATGTVVVGVDHGGKDASAGVRGASAKEGAADFVLVVLCDRELGGRVKDTRLAVRKLRSGATGIEIPFAPRAVGPTLEPSGKIASTLVIDWLAAGTPAAARPQWPRHLRPLRRATDMELDKHGRELRPFDDDPLIVRAVELARVHAEYDKTYPAEGDGKHQADARRKAFDRHIKAALEMHLLAVREIGGTTYIWLVSDKGSA